MKELYIQPSEISKLSEFRKWYYYYYVVEMKKKEKEEIEKNGPPQKRTYSWVGQDKREMIKQKQEFIIDKLRKEGKIN